MGVRFAVAVVVMLAVSFASTLGLLNYVEANDKPSLSQICVADHIGPQPPEGWPACAPG